MDNALVPGQMAAEGVIALTAHSGFSPDLATSNAILILTEIAAEAVMAAVEKTFGPVGGAGHFRS